MASPVIAEQQRRILRLEAEITLLRARTLAAEQKAELKTKDAADAWQFAKFVQSPVREPSKGSK